MNAAANLPHVAAMQKYIVSGWLSGQCHLWSSSHRRQTCSPEFRITPLCSPLCSWRDGRNQGRCSQCLSAVVLAMVAETHADTCNANSLVPCLAAIEGANPPWPSRACCNVVRAADKNCNQLRSSSLPAQLVKNGLKVPNKWGRTDLRGYKCGREWLSDPLDAC